LSRVEDEVVDHDLGGVAGSGSPQQSTTPSHQDRVGERLAEIVVRAQVEHAAFVRLSISCRQHQEGGPESLRPQAGADLNKI
jgi:hypothetical protein